MSDLTKWISSDSDYWTLIHLSLAAICDSPLLPNTSQKLDFEDQGIIASSIIEAAKLAHYIGGQCLL
jgi:hypothetical protein